MHQGILHRFPVHDASQVRVARHLLNIRAHSLHDHITRLVITNRICGRIGTAPPLHWYIDDQQPEDVTIVMENIGLDDGRAEGFSFSLQGDENKFLENFRWV